MVLEFPFSFEDVDFIRIATGFFIMLLFFGLLQKSKILGRNKAAHLVISLIIAIYVVSNDAISNFLLDLSSNVALLVLMAVVFVMMMALTNASAFLLFVLFFLILLVLVLIGIYPFYLVLDYIPEGLITLFIVITIGIMILLLIFRERKEPD